MAAARVYGTVDGIEVILQRAEGDRWSVPVPLDQDGEYAVEIIAEDEAGNRSYLARMIFLVDSGNLCVHLVPELYYAELLEPVYSASVVPPLYWEEIIEPQCAWKGGERCSV